MAYTMKTNLANKNNYGSKRDTKDIKYIVIHYTGNDGDTDENNGKYFHNNIVKASAHYFIDDDSITQSVPDNYVAWSVGGSKYSNADKLGGGKFYGKCTNANSISIELCDDVKNGVVYPSAGTIANAIAFTKTLMKKYNVPASNVIRHADVNGKSCPAYWYGTTAKDNKWKTEFHNKLTATTSTTSKVESYSGYVKVLYNGLAIHNKASWDDSTISGTVKKDQIFTVVGRIKVDGVYMYKLKSGAYITSASKYVQYMKTLPTATKTIKVGAKVKVKSTATKYATGQAIPSWVKGSTYTIKEIDGSKILLKEITSWVYTKDVTLV